jgi:hypothetical protein
MAHGEVDGQQHRDAADLDRGEQQARIRAMQEQDVQQQSEQAEAERKQATHCVPRSRLVEVHQLHEERRADGPRCRSEQRADDEQR